MAIRRRKDSPAYMIDLYYHDENGKQKRLRRSAGTGTTLKEAQKLERRWKKELEFQGFEIAEDIGLSVKYKQPDKEAAFSGFTKHFYDNYCLANNKPSELQSKKMILTRHMNAFFGDQDLRSIDQEQIVAYIAQKKREGLSPKTINNHLAVLQKMLNTARDWGYMEHNPMSGLRKLKTPIASHDFYTEEERDKFLATCKEREEFWYPFFLTAFLTGMRLGELCALRWGDIGFHNSTITVQRSVWQGEVNSPKSGRSRTVPLHPALKELMRPMKGKKDETVFTTKSGKELTRNSMRKPFRRVQKAAGLKEIRLHDIRHSFASQLVMKGQPMKVVQELLGHSDIRMTDIYSHLSPCMNKEAIQCLLPSTDRQKCGHSVGTVVDFIEFRKTSDKEKARKNNNLRAK